MSEFSKILSYFVKSRDISVSAMVKYCGLDRSTMYKFINGKRTPASRALVEKMAEYMNLNPVETGELLEAYHITEIGEDTYYSRKGVLDFILSFNGISYLSNVKNHFKGYIDFSSDFTPPPQILLL